MTASRSLDRLAALRRETSILLGRLEEAIRLSEEVQYDRPPHRTSRSEVIIRAKGAYSDPTGDLAVDPTRLSLRDAVKQTERDLDHVLRQVQGLDARLRRSLDRWEAEGP